MQSVENLLLRVPSFARNCPTGMCGHLGSGGPPHPQAAEVPALEELQAQVDIYLEALARGFVRCAGQRGGAQNLRVRQARLDRRDAETRRDASSIRHEFQLRELREAQEVAPV
ncbi:hypothetical protein [Deinococcus hopiensis]|uniref:Uncharacterized protein n=1 Tax=Deinococcus hopiensis KR-140 TaxID=695939 RepID=A0A1W1VBH3_9DEIO|nr:hypothetical protein [Deinococcus hopiensis]SMB90540.1 hypothetical protein SAMN00790413_00809 [Deinococcus hopiensis KR-140]